MANKKNKKLVMIIFITSILAVLIIGGIFAFLHFSTPAQIKTSATSSDKQATLTARFFDQNGNPMNMVRGSYQAILATGGGYYNITTYVVFDLNATNTGAYTLYNVTFNAGSLSPSLVGAFGTTNRLPQLTAGQSGSLGSTEQSCVGAGTQSTCDVTSHEWCIGSTPTCKINLNALMPVTGFTAVPFTVGVIGDIYNALQILQVGAVTSSPATINYNVYAENCNDSGDIIPIGNCSVIDKPRYCKFNLGGQTSLPTAIDNATYCGCPTNYKPNGNSCTIITCGTASYTTPLFNCSSPSYGSMTAGLAGLTPQGIYGAYLYCLPFNSTSGKWQQRCIDCGAKQDYYGGSATCIGSAGAESNATYGSYSGSLTAGLGGR